MVNYVGHHVNDITDKNGRIISTDAGNIIRNSECLLLKPFNTLAIEETYLNTIKAKYDKLKGNLLHEKTWNHLRSGRSALTLANFT